MMEIHFNRAELPSDEALVQMVEILNCSMIELNDEHIFVNGVCVGCPCKDGRD